MSCKLEPVIWSCDTGQQIPCFDRCQMTVTWMSNIKEGCYKPRVYVSVNLLAPIWPPSCTTCSCHCHRCVYVPTSNTASHDNHGKIYSPISFSFLSSSRTALHPIHVLLFLVNMASLPTFDVTIVFVRVC